MTAHRRRRWAFIKPTLVYRLVFAGMADAVHTYSYCESGHVYDIAAENHHKTAGCSHHLLKGQITKGK